MTALAPTLEAFFTQRLAAQRDASPHTVAAYRDTLRLLLVFAQNRTGTPPSRLDVGDLDAALIARVPHPSGNRARQQRVHPQRPAHRDPLAVPLRRPAASRTRRVDPAGARHPRQTPRADTGVLPDPRGDRRTAVRARPRHLVRPPRSRPAHVGRPNRPAGLRTDPTRLPRHPSRRRRLRSLPRQGTQRPRDPADRPHRRRAHHLAARTQLRPNRSAVPDPSRPTVEHRRGRLAAHQTRRHRGPTAARR